MAVPQATPPPPPPAWTSPIRWIVGLIGGVCLLLIGLIVIGLVRISKESALARRKAEQLQGVGVKPSSSDTADLRRRLTVLEGRVVKLESERKSAGAAPAAEPAALEPDRRPPPATAPERPSVRVKPEAGEPPGRNETQDRIDAGLKEFKGGRYELAESQFFRAMPDATLYLILTSFARGEFRDAVSSLARAMEADPNWLRKVRPRTAFGTAEEFAQKLAVLEAQVRQNPMDADAKVLLAYLYFHEKSASYAKALLVEVTGADPNNVTAAKFLEGLK